MKYPLDVLTILDYSPLATAIYDNSDLRIAFANVAMLKMWRVDTSIIGQRFGTVFPGFKKEGFVSILENVWNTGITYKDIDAPAYIVDGEERHLRYFDFEYKALVNEHGQTYAILHSATDVTLRKQTINQLHSQQETMVFNNDLEALTYTLSHDIMNPLSTAKMGIAFLQRQGNIPLENQSKWYQTISQALVDMENIIKQTAKLSEARSISNDQKFNELTPVLPIWCKEVQALYNSHADHITFGKLLPIYGDIDALCQIFTHIINNAVKYSLQVPAPSVNIYSEKTEEGTAYFIVDNGIGMSPSELDKIFCVFKGGPNTVTDRSNGIGLCLAKRIIERYSGTINVSSEQGKGTIVRLYFPDHVTPPEDIHP